MSTPRLTVVVGRPGAEPPVRPYHHTIFSGPHVVEGPSAADWPFQRSVTPPDPARLPLAIVIPNLHRAFPAGQTSGTRLVLTQSTYQLQRWIDWLDAHPDVHVIGLMQAAATSLSGEALARRGPWSRIELQEAEAGRDPYSPHGTRFHENPPLLAAFLQPDAQARLIASRQALEDAPDNAALHLAAASALMELEQRDAAIDAIESALSIAPDWEAAHFEAGKLWLRSEEMEHAAAAFTEAARLMPNFSAAFSNLGAVMGELERRDDALAALQQALRSDPRGYPVLNNLGAVHRDSGRLAEAEAAFRQVVAIAPGFVFGHYNLGQVLMMQGRITEARDAYEAGVARDGQKNPRQAMRLAAVRAAAGDPEGAVADVARVLARVPETSWAGLLGETESTLTALSAMSGVSDADLSRVLDVVRRYSV